VVSCARISHAQVHHVGARLFGLALLFCKRAKTFQPAPPFPTNLLLRKIFAGALKTGGVLCAYFTRTSPPRRNATFCQPPAYLQVAMTLRSVAPFPTNLLLRKIFAGALKTGGVLCAYFTRTSPPNQNNPNPDEKSEFVLFFAKDFFGVKIPR